MKLAILLIAVSACAQVATVPKNAPRLSYFIPAGENAWKYPLWIDTSVLAVVPIGTTGQFLLTTVKQPPAQTPSVTGESCTSPTSKLVVRLPDGSCLPVILAGPPSSTSLSSFTGTMKAPSGKITFEGVVDSPTGLVIGWRIRDSQALP